MKRSNPSSQSASSSRKPSTSRAPESKKTRFVSPEEDPARFAEDVDAQLEDSRRAANTRKGGVRVEGYDSDSSDDGEGVVLSRRKGEDGEGDEDEDMFAMDDKGDKKDAEAPKKKKAEYLRLADIEGQEFNDGSGKSENGDSDSEPDDMDEAERRAKKGMGYEMTHFNMRDELEEGRVTEEGDYVRTADPHAMHDRWLEETGEREIKKARKAQKRQQKLEQERERKEAGEDARLRKDEAEKEIVGILKKGETVLEALARLGEKAKKAKEMEKRTSKQNLHAPAKAAIERLTSLASTLLSFGDVDAYNKTYEQFLRAVRAAGEVEADWVPPSSKYEYKWDIPTASNVATDSPGGVFGPFGEDELRAWYDAGYFGPTAEKIKIRPIGGDWGDWDDVID